MPAIEGQGMEAQEEEKGHTWVNTSCSQTQVPGGIREVHTGRTQGTHRIAGMGTPWSAPGTSCVALGEVQSLSPHVFIVWCVVEAAYADCPQQCTTQDWWQYKFFRKYIMHLLFSMNIRWENQLKVIHWLTSYSYLKFGSLSLFFLTLRLFSRGCKA